MENILQHTTRSDSLGRLVLVNRVLVIVALKDSPTLSPLVTIGQKREVPSEP